MYSQVFMIERILHFWDIDLFHVCTNEATDKITTLDHAFLKLVITNLRKWLLDTPTISSLHLFPVISQISLHFIHMKLDPNQITVSIYRIRI